MKKRYRMMGSFVVTAACLSMSALADTDSDGAVAANEAKSVAVESTGQVAEDAPGRTADEAAELVQEAVQVVEKIGEELEAEADHDEPDGHADQAEHTDQVGGHSAQAMAQWMAKSRPGEHHTPLDGFVGQWDVTVSFWMAPGMPPQVNQGTSEIKWILDGRFIQENFQSVMQMGDESETFKGFGLTGYDNIKEQYVGIWADTLSTALIESTGQIDENTGSLILASVFDDPMTGQPTSMRTVMRQVGGDELLMEAYRPLGGEEFKCLEIIYTRRP